VPLDVPLGKLGEVLGDGTGASVSLRGGPVVLPHQTFGEVGMDAGSTVQVDGLAVQVVAGPVAGNGRARGYQAGRQVQRARWPVSRGRLALSAAVAGAWRSGLSSPAVRCSEADRSLRHRLWPSSPARQRKRGGRPSASPCQRAETSALSSAGEARLWRAPGVCEVVVRPGPFERAVRSRSPYGLTVVVYKDYVVYPPTPSPLRLIERPGAHVPETGAGVSTNVARSVENWAKTTFAATGALRPAGLGLAGKAQVLEEWRPRSGRAWSPGFGSRSRARTASPSTKRRGTSARLQPPESVLRFRERLLSAGGRTAGSPGGAGPAAVGGAARLRLAEERAGADDAATCRPYGLGAPAVEGGPLDRGLLPFRRHPN
jgi:hypothetical protein